MQELKNLVIRLRASLWLVPGLVSLAAAGLAYLLLSSNWDIISLEESEHWWLFSGDAGTARDLLASLLSGMITMTSLVVSITMVVLSLAAGQLGPRLIGRLMGDREIQVVLGLFMGTILYTLLVLRSITDELGADLVPHIAITVASALVVLCLFALLFYVHKIAKSIIADTIIGSVAGELEHAIRSAAEDDERGADTQVELARYDRHTWVSVGKAGYVQVVDYKSLVDVASRSDVLLRVDIRGGHFLLRGGEHVEVHSNQPLAEDLHSEILRSIVVGADRTPTQDLEFSMRQLVEIALRALSPGINDPFTAIAVIDRLGSALETAGNRSDLPVIYRDHDRRVRLIATSIAFQDLLNAAFDQIRQAGAKLPAILIQMARVIGQLAIVIDDIERRGSLLDHLGKLDRAAENLPDPADRADYLAVAVPARERLASSMVVA